MEQRVKIKHDGPRGWAGIAASAFDPARHELYEVAKQTKPATAPAAPATNIEAAADDEAQSARMVLTDDQIKAMGRDDLRQQLDGMGVDFDARWGEAKLRTALIDAIAEARD